MQTHWDVIVVGAGPSGMACAATAAERGLQVLVLDEQPMPGGQLYRHIEAQSDATLKIFGKDYFDGFTLVRRFRESGAEYLPQSIVWKVGSSGRVCYSRHGVSHELEAKRVVVATGATERPVPFAGWTLPGVLAAGGADALFKSSGILPDGPVAMVGSGPLMLLVAQHLKGAGIKVSHMLDTTPSGSMFGALPHLPKAMKRMGYLLKGVGMLGSTMRSVGKTIRGVTSFSVSGDKRAQNLTAIHDGVESSIPVSTVLVHEGIIPRTEFSRQLRLNHAWDYVQRYWYPQVDSYGKTSNPVVYMVGDGAYVHGGVAASIKGELAGLSIVRELEKLDWNELQQQASPFHTALKNELAPRPFVDAMYRPRPNLYDMPDETLVCRCEEVTAGFIRETIALGHKTPEMVKAVTRCGMGPCQGRMCTLALNEIIAAETETSMQQMVPPTVRPPVRNLPLGELAKMTLLPTPEAKENA